MADESGYKVYFLLLSSLTLLLCYMGVTHDRSPRLWVVAVILAAIVAAASGILARRNPAALLQIVTVFALAVAIFAGVTWFYSRNRTAGMITAVAAPLAFCFALGSLRLKR